MHNSGYFYGGWIMSTQFKDIAMRYVGENFHQTHSPTGEIDENKVESFINQMSNVDFLALLSMTHELFTDVIRRDIIREIPAKNWPRGMHD